MEHTIPAALASAAREFGDAPALAGPGGPRLSWRQLHARATALSRAFYADGIRPGDRVAIWSPNTHHWVLGALGALGAGATLVPVNTRFTGPEALDVIGRSGAPVLIVAGPFLGTDRLAALRAAAAGEDSGSGGGRLARLRRIVQVPVEEGQAVADGAVGWAEFEERAAAASADVAGQAGEQVAAVRPDDISDILFTSGTTGRSKGVMSAHRQSLAVARAWAQCGRLTSDDRYLVINPFFCLAERSLPGCILVNGGGQRFVNESAPYVDAVHAMYAGHSPAVPHIPSWLVTDQRYRDSYAGAGATSSRT